MHSSFFGDMLVCVPLLDYISFSLLTDTHLKVLKLLAQRCETNSQGLAFDELYDLCYSRLFVKNRPALTMILRELQV